MGRYMAPIIKQKIEEQGEEYRERTNTIHTRCPRCGRDDKFSILKENGSCICYHGSCDFGTQFFEFWLAEVAGLPIKAARKQIYGSRRDKPSADYIPNPFVQKEEKKEVQDILVPLPWPPTKMTAKGKREEALLIDSPEAEEGLRYLESRNIPLEIAKKFNITYFPWSRRVVFPVLIGDRCYGWQARSIDPDCKIKALTSEDFKRGITVMFANQMKAAEHVIICEGPVDAIKFCYVGGAVCTMGKEVTTKQLDFIMSYGPQRIYLALDPDATDEMKKIDKYCDIPVYAIEVPESCIVRSQSEGKKADFGECSYREAYIAWAQAKKFNSVIMEYVNPIFNRGY